MKSKLLQLGLLLIIFRIFGRVSSFFDIEELKSFNYGIDIRNEPVVMKTDDEPTDLNSVQLTSKYGQLYQCNFPNTVEQSKEKEEAEKVAVETGIPDLLKPMESGPCLKMNNGWWSYEFCYGREISQYHLNEESKIEGDVLSLGIYESEFDWEDNPAQSELERKQNLLRRYHTQQYINGTKCDLNGNHRKTEVRFICEEGSGDYIKRVDEPETCSYIMTIHTTKICHHPFLKPPTPTKTVSITCHPLLTVIQYQEYLDELEAKEELKLREAEEKQKLKEEELQRVAKEKAKYFEGTQDKHEEEEEEELEDGTILKDSNNLLKDMISAAKEMDAGDNPVEVNTVFQVINDPSDVDEFIKKAIKEMERVGKESKKKKKDLDHEGKYEEEDLEEQDEKIEEEFETDEEHDEQSQRLNTDDMQRFDGKGSEDLSTEEVQQAVNALKKAQRDNVKTLSKLGQLKLETLRKKAVKKEQNKAAEEEEEEGIVEEETEEDDLQDKAPEKKQKLFEDVEKHMKTLKDMKKYYRDKLEGDDLEDEDLSVLMDKVDQQLSSMLNAQKVMEGISNDLNQLLKGDTESDDETKTIKSKYQEKRSRLLHMKQRLKKLMAKQYESIVKEAEEELGVENEIERDTAMKELSSTLDGLLAKMDRTEQEIKDVDKELEQFADFDSEEKHVKSIPPVRDDLDPVKGPADADGNDRVQVRVSRIKPGQKFLNTAKDKQTEALEKSVQEELTKAGFANGDKIQVKIITSYYDGDDDSVHTLSEKDSETFRNLIVNLIGGTSEGDKEAARHQEQEDNYSFVFGHNKKTITPSASKTDMDAMSHTDTNTNSHTSRDSVIDDDGS